MLLPAIQYGDWKDVRPRIKAIVRRVKRGEDIIAVMSEGGMLDTSTTPGMLIVGGTMRPGWTNFHCHEPWKQLLLALEDVRVSRDEALQNRIFNASLSTTWGVLGLMAYSNLLWFSGRHDWYEPFVDAASRAWDEIDAVGARYFVALHPESMWDMPNGLKQVLAKLGVPTDRLRAPLPPGGPRELLKYARVAS